MLRRLRWNGTILDDALVLAFPAPNSATGEDVIELHLHGGRATVAAVTEALGVQPDLRAAEPGEFTRRALLNGRLDLSQVEGLADLLAAETELQRRISLSMAEGGLSRLVERWREQVLDASAKIEAAIDYADEDDVVPWPERSKRLHELVAELDRALAAPSAERIREGYRVVVLGPPNAGKSTLVNALAEREAAIVSPIAGTTRDRIDVPLQLAGVPIVLVDTAGLHDATSDEIEREGMRRAEAAAQAADLVLWLGDSNDAPSASSELINAKCDVQPSKPGLAVSALTGEGLDALRRLIVDRAQSALHVDDDFSTTQRQRDGMNALREELIHAQADDLLLAAEHLRRARLALQKIAGRSDIEAMLDSLFSRFCVGK